MGNQLMLETIESLHDDDPSLKSFKGQIRTTDQMELLVMAMKQNTHCSFLALRAVWTPALTAQLIELMEHLHANVTTLHIACKPTGRPYLGLADAVFQACRGRLHSSSAILEKNKQQLSKTLANGQGEEQQHSQTVIGDNVAVAVSIQTLILEASEFDEESAHALHKMLTSNNPLLKRLEIIQSDLRLHEMTVMDSIAEGLKLNHTLQHLSLRECVLSPAGVELLAFSLQEEACCLQALDLSRTCISETEVQALFEALIANPKNTCERLDISYNREMHKIALTLAPLLPKSGLKQLYLEGWFGAWHARQVFCRLSHHLHTNTTLETLQHSYTIDSTKTTMRTRTATYTNTDNSNADQPAIPDIHDDEGETVESNNDNGADATEASGESTQNEDATQADEEGGFAETNATRETESQQVEQQQQQPSMAKKGTKMHAYIQQVNHYVSDVHRNILLDWQSDQQQLPLGLWPHILERSYHNSGGNPGVLMEYFRGNPDLFFGRSYTLPEPVQMDLI